MFIRSLGERCLRICYQVQTIELYLYALISFSDSGIERKDYSLPNLQVVEEGCMAMWAGKPSPCRAYINSRFESIASK